METRTNTAAPVAVDKVNLTDGLIGMTSLEGLYTLARWLRQEGHHAAAVDLECIAHSYKGDAARMSDLQDEVSDLQDEVSDLQDEVSDLEYQVSDLEDQVSDLEDQVSDLEGEVSDLKDILDDVEVGS